MKNTNIFNETLTTLERRRSCRAFKPDMISEAELNAILNAGTYAPTGMGKQSPYIVAVQNLRNASLLDGRHIFEVHVVKRIENIIVQICFFECH